MRPDRIHSKSLNSRKRTEGRNIQYVTDGPAKEKVNEIGYYTPSEMKKPKTDRNKKFRYKKTGAKVIGKIIH